MVPAVDTALSAVPERTNEQRMRALRRANEIRTARAQLKRDLKRGKGKVEQLLRDPPEYVLSAKAFDMIVAVPKYGRVKANKILTQCRISPSKTTGGLAAPTRGALGPDSHVPEPEDFAPRVREGDFLEHAAYSCHRYGTLRSEVDRRLAAGRSVVLEIEVQGARQVRAAMPESVQVFIAPPNPQALRARLEGRGTDSAEAISERPRAAQEELTAPGAF